jgi:hypothetical protein
LNFSSNGHEQGPINIICNSYHKFYKIPQHVGLLQFMSRPWPNGLPYKYCWYNVDYLKAQIYSSHVNVYKEVLRFPDYYNWMLCIISTRLQVDMFAQSMSLNFCKCRQNYPKDELKSMQFGPILGLMWVACSNALTNGFVIFDT